LKLYGKDGIAGGGEIGGEIGGALSNLTTLGAKSTLNRQNGTTKPFSVLKIVGVSSSSPSSPSSSSSSSSSSISPSSFSFSSEKSSPSTPEVNKVDIYDTSNSNGDNNNKRGPKSPSLSILSFIHRQRDKIAPSGGSAATATATASATASATATATQKSSSLRKPTAVQTFKSIMNKKILLNERESGSPSSSSSMSKSISSSSPQVNLEDIYVDSSVPTTWEEAYPTQTSQSGQNLLLDGSLVDYCAIDVLQPDTDMSDSAADTHLHLHLHHAPRKPALPVSREKANAHVASAKLSYFTSTAACRGFGGLLPRQFPEIVSLTHFSL